ncbi:MAG TPA: peptidoglycan DD-metalloendopeptidase family protein [Pseudolabrys sp.]|nr:peptidoglycan DD-metalloendopeptidase family protein [Pseudolabrys sp.]
MRPSQTAPQNSEKIDALKQRDQELQSTREEQKKAADKEAALKREIEEIGADRRKINQDLIDTASRVRQVETSIAATEARLKPLDDNESLIRKSLEGRRAVIAEVLAALQRIGRRPPPALLVSPEDALASVRSAILLGAVLPEMREQTQALANDLGELLRVRKAIADERAKLQTDLAAIAQDRERMTLLMQERAKQQSDSEKALEAERARATALAQQADNLKDLIAKLEQGLDSATKAQRDAAKGDSRPALSAFRDPGRLAPAVAFASLRGQIPLPVNGIKLREFGASDNTGGTEKGISIATRAAAQVTAPCDGWVVYAGNFRSYGQLLILNAGGGYHVLLAGMERISVDLGQFVLTGEPVAVMGSGSHIAAVLATGSTQPVLYVEFRKDGIPVDPGPWWAANEGEKVRG